MHFKNNNIKLVYAYIANFKCFNILRKTTLKGSKLDFLYV